MSDSPKFKEALEEECERRFKESLEKLKHVHTHEDLEKVRAEVFKRRDELFKASTRIRNEIRNKQMLTQNRARFQTIRSEADRIRRNAFNQIDSGFMDPHMRRIQEHFRSKAVKSSFDLVCPECEDRDHGNKKNKKPWCLKCNVPLIKRKDLKKWKKNRIKVVKK